MNNDSPYEWDSELEIQIVDLEEAISDDDELYFDDLFTDSINYEGNWS